MLTAAWVGSVEIRPTSGTETGFLESIFSGTVAPPYPALPAGRGGRQPESLMTTMAKSTVRTIGSSVGREIVRGLMGSIFGGGGRRR